MEELKKEVREARRIKMLHYPSKVGLILLSLNNSVYRLELVYSIILLDDTVGLFRPWIWKMKYELYARNLLRDPQIVLIF
jgi:hypothetical protein